MQRRQINGNSAQEHETGLFDPTTVALHRRFAEPASSQGNARVDFALPQDVPELERRVDRRALLSGSSACHDSRAARHAGAAEVCASTSVVARAAVRPLQRLYKRLERTFRLSRRRASGWQRMLRLSSHAKFCVHF